MDEAILHLERMRKEGMVNACTIMNSFTIRDANLPPAPEGSAEEFADLATASVVDLFFGYGQFGLAKESRDMTAIQTSLGFLRMTRLPQGGTNSVAQLLRGVGIILKEHIPERCRPFLDDFGVKGPRSRYNEEEGHARDTPIHARTHTSTVSRC